MYGFGGLRGIQHGKLFGVFPRYAQIPRSYPFEKEGVFAFHAVGGSASSGEAFPHRFHRQIEQKTVDGPDGSASDFEKPAYLRPIHPPPVSLIGESGPSEPIRQNDSPVLQGRGDYFGDKLGPGRGKQKQIGGGRDGVFRGKEQLAYPVGNRGAAGLADRRHPMAPRFQASRQKGKLGRLSAAVQALKGEKAGMPYQAPAPWHFLNFWPLPQGQGSLRPTFLRSMTGAGLAMGRGAGGRVATDVCAGAEARAGAAWGAPPASSSTCG